MGRCARGIAGRDLNHLCQDICIRGQGFVQVVVSLSIWGELG